MDNPGITILYHQHLCERVQCEIFRTYVVEGGINGILSIEKNILQTVKCIIRDEIDIQNVKQQFLY